MSDTTARVCRLVAEHFGERPRRITLATRLEELGAELDDRLELGLALEDEFIVALPGRNITEFDSVADLVRMVERAGG